MGREENPLRFFILIANTIVLIVIWMLTNLLIGLYFGYAFFENSPTWQNIVYYACFLNSLFFLARHIIKKWK